MKNIDKQLKDGEKEEEGNVKHYINDYIKSFFIFILKPNISQYLLQSKTICL